MLDMTNDERTNAKARARNLVAQLEDQRKEVDEQIQAARAFLTSLVDVSCSLTNAANAQLQVVNATRALAEPIRNAAANVRNLDYRVKLARRAERKLVESNGLTWCTATRAERGLACVRYDGFAQGWANLWTVLANEG